MANKALPDGLPDGLELQRVTAEFTSTTVPKGLLRAHRIAEGVWGVLRVRAGQVRFVVEDGDTESVTLHAGDHQLIEPGVPHHVEPDDEARFAVEFYKGLS